MQRGIINKNELLVHILAGDSIFTIESLSSGEHFTFKVNQCKSKDTLFFVSVLTGPNNTSDYSYIGTYTTNVGYVHGKKSKISEDALSVITFKWILRNINNPTINQATFYHEGFCCKCGRSLTTPDSVSAGYGPVCAAYFSQLRNRLIN